MEFNHIPVLLEAVLEYMQPFSGGAYVDGTLGGGGHAEEILKRIGPSGRLIGIDRDLEAIGATSDRLRDYGNCFVPVHGNHGEVLTILQKLKIDGVDGMLMDLGVSSHQLNTEARGFTYQEDVPMDMRMDTTQDLSAEQVVNDYSERDLAQVLWEYGEERWAKRIAEFIVAQRPIKTTGQLVEAIKAAVPAGARRDGPHPARRTFQAIRIEVNQEIAGLESAVRNAVMALHSGGRLLIISFHSLEDRIVKNTYRQLADPCTCPKSAPICICEKVPLIKVITRKPILPTKEEEQQNSRSRSAKLRVCQRL